MPIAVTLPDGSTIQVPSIKREVKSSEIGSSETVVFEEPAPHPDYRFVPGLGGWAARPKRPNRAP